MSMNTLKCVDGVSYTEAIRAEVRRQASNTRQEILKLNAEIAWDHYGDLWAEMHQGEPRKRYLYAAGSDGTILRVESA